ncbi:OB-fold nucleic acid binding domain-containing protein, partial [Aliarcobacter butzleri]
MFENIYIQQRIEKANKLREDGINPYSNESSRNCTISKYLNVNSDIFQLEEKRDENRNYTVAGRIKFFRLMGKASFLKIEDESGMLQIYVARDNLPENFYNEIFKKNIEVGDIIEVSG